MVEETWESRPTLERWDWQKKYNQAAFCCSSMIRVGHFTRVLIAPDDIQLNVYLYGLNFIDYRNLYKYYICKTCNPKIASSQKAAADDMLHWEWSEQASMLARQNEGMKGAARPKTMLWQRMIYPLTARSSKSHNFTPPRRVTMFEVDPSFATGQTK